MNETNAAQAGPVRIDLVPEPQPITPPKDPPAVILELTEEQARLLRTVLGMVRSGTRYQTLPIFNALANAGFSIIPDAADHSVVNHLWLR